MVTHNHVAHIEENQVLSGKKKPDALSDQIIDFTPYVRTYFLVTI